MLLKILALPRSSYYYHIKQLKPVDKNKVLKAKIKMIYDEHKGNYGYRRITLELRNQAFSQPQKGATLNETHDFDCPYSS